MKEKNLKIVWLVSIFVLLFLFAIYLININKDDMSSDVSNSKNYEIVSNYGDFYTVNSCVYRYLTYVQSSNTSALLKVLDDDYVSKNGINSANIYNYLTKYDGNVNFSSQKMYVEKVSKNIYKYYVYGYVEKDIMDSFPEKYDAYFIVILDKKENIFTIEPYNGEIFR